MLRRHNRQLIHRACHKHIIKILTAAPRYRQWYLPAITTNGAVRATQAGTRKAAYKISNKSHNCHGQAERKHFCFAAAPRHTIEIHHVPAVRKTGRHSVPTLRQPHKAAHKPVRLIADAGHELLPHSTNGNINTQNFFGI